MGQATSNFSSGFLIVISNFMINITDSSMVIESSSSVISIVSVVPSKEQSGLTLFIVGGVDPSSGVAPNCVLLQGVIQFHSSSLKSRTTL